MTLSAAPTYVYGVICACMEVKHVYTPYILADYDQSLSDNLL